MKRLVLILCLLAAPLAAVEPGEVLDDPVLEARARELSKELRCLVCQNENIDSSDASVAQDLRIVVRDRLLAGDSDEEVLAYIADRYPEFVFLRPTWARGGGILWLIGPLVLLASGAFAWGALRRRQTAPVALTAEEEARLEALTRED